MSMQKWHEEMAELKGMYGEDWNDEPFIILADIGGRIASLVKGTALCTNDLYYEYANLEDEVDYDEYDDDGEEIDSDEFYSDEFVLMYGYTEHAFKNSSEAYLFLPRLAYNEHAFSYGKWLTEKSWFRGLYPKQTMGEVLEHGWAVRLTNVPMNQPLILATWARPTHHGYTMDDYADMREQYNCSMEEAICLSNTSYVGGILCDSCSDDMGPFPPGITEETLGYFLNRRVPPYLFDDFNFTMFSGKGSGKSEAMERGEGATFRELVSNSRSRKLLLSQLREVALKYGRDTDELQ